MTTRKDLLHENSLLRQRLAEVEDQLNQMTHHSVLATEERFNFLLSQIPAMFFTADLAGELIRITCISDSVREILGFEPRQYYEDPHFWLSLIHTDDLALGTESYRALFETGQVVWQCRTRRVDGQYLWMSTGMKLIYDAQGQPQEIIGYSVDTNEKKKLEEALRISENRLLQVRSEMSVVNAAIGMAARVNDEFLSGVGHELRTPLMGILGLAEALQINTYGALNERQEKALQHIESSGRLLLNLINDVIDLSKLEAGKLELHFEICSLAEICQSSLHSIKESAAQKRQLVSFSMNPTPLVLRADAYRVKQMLGNLLSNAVKLTPEGGSLGLAVQGVEKEQVIHLSVWDQGVEIKPEETAHLFKPFEPSNTHLSHSYSGSGPGLALVQRLAELHGGSVKVESAPGQGSRFTITIPWYNRDASWTPAQTDLATLATAFQTVMIVDDSSIAAEHIQNHLKNLGIVQVVLHHRAQSVFERVQETRPSLILLDIILPDGSGWDVLQKLKTAPETQHIPVIVISVMEDRFKAIQLGAADSLPKPIARHDLHTALSKIHQAQLAARQKNAVLTEVVHGQGVRILLAEDNDANVMLICDYLTAQGYEIIVAHNGDRKSVV